MNTKQKIAITVSLILVSSIAIIAPNIIINASKSHIGTIFLKSDGTPKKYDFVYFDSPSGLLKDRILSKKLICIAGDRLVINEFKMQCNDKYYPIWRYKTTSSKKIIPQFYFNDIVPNNKVAVYTTHIESFDSRYYGLLDLAKLNKMIIIF